jgi:hypothetical protein
MTLWEVVDLVAEALRASRAPQRVRDAFAARIRALNGGHLPTYFPGKAPRVVRKFRVRTPANRLHSREGDHE